jgi:hypothetical protein
MENRGLLFIPDISGFTKFISKMEIDHSRLIIQELLEVLINANEIGLEVSEIEGDAILFYKFGDSPELEKIYKQVEMMFREFHKRLLSYDYRRFCQCKACSSVIDLTLKVITHYGEFTDYHVKNFNKLLGKDVIVAHQLLKNDVEQHEYWLVTNDLLQNHEPVDFATWMKWQIGKKEMDSGEIAFHFTQLSPLKNHLEPEPLPQLELSTKAKMISLSKEYDTDIITLFHATGDFTFRNRWMEGVKTVEEVNHFLPRVGMRCRCVMENGQVMIYTSSYTYHPDRIEFSEMDDESKSLTYYLLEKTDNNKTRLTLDYYVKRNIAAQAMFRLMRERNLESVFQKSMLNLVDLVKQIDFSVEQDNS